MTLKKEFQNGSRLPARIIAAAAVAANFSLYKILSTLVNGRQEKNSFA